MSARPSSVSPVPTPATTTTAAASAGSAASWVDLRLEQSSLLLRAPDQIVQHRSGDVLSSNIILKAAQYPGKWNRPNNGGKGEIFEIADSGINSKLQPQFAGAPNFRQVDQATIDVYGVALPTVNGAAAVLVALGTGATTTTTTTQTGASSSVSAAGQVQAPSATTAASTGTTGTTGTTITAASAVGAGTATGLPASEATAGSPSPSVAPAQLIMPGTTTTATTSANAPLSDGAAAASGRQLGPRSLSSGFARSSTAGLLPPVVFEPRKCVWFNVSDRPIVYINGTPYVVRELDAPLESDSMFAGLDANRLEQMEMRLQADVEREALRTSGMVLVHEEQSPGVPVPTWIAASQIQTPRQVFEQLAQRFDILYYRVPISMWLYHQSKYFDAFIQTIRETNPNDAVVFSCRMGTNRTTFGMVAAAIIRRTQLLNAEKAETSILRKRGSDEEKMTKMLLRLVFVLEQALKPTKGAAEHAGSAIEWALARGSLISSLGDALTGHYQVITNLIRYLANGPQSKLLVDDIIDRCEAMINLRESILVHRVRYSADPSKEGAALHHCIVALERYIYLIAFASHVSENAKNLSKRLKQPSGSTISTEPQTFKQWMESQPALQNMLHVLRRSGPKLVQLRPVEDLSTLSPLFQHGAQRPKADIPDKSVLHSQLESSITRHRHGTVLGPRTILKLDHWPFKGMLPSIVDGAPNFRRVGDMYLFGSAQPTAAGLRAICGLLNQRANAAASMPPAASSIVAGIPAHLKVVWINLREEPLVYIDGNPFVLRDQFATLRNIKSYSGIAPRTLEDMERRLCTDVMKEAEEYDGAILVHREMEGGVVQGTMTEVTGRDQHRSLTAASTPDVLNDSGSSLVSPLLLGAAPLAASSLELGPSALPAAAADPALATPRQLFLMMTQVGFDVTYHRIPITAEQLPEFSDFDAIVRLICSYDPRRTAFVFNCQIGSGRSTIGTVIARLVIRWLSSMESEVPEDESVGNGSRAMAAEISAAAAAPFPAAGTAPTTPATPATPGTPSTGAFGSPSRRGRTAANPLKKQFTLANDPPASDGALSSAASAGASALVGDSGASVSRSPATKLTITPVAGKVDRIAVSSDTNQYRGVLALMRVLQNGLECKAVVDEAIDVCGAVINLRESVDLCRKLAEQESDETRQHVHIRTGIAQLKRYFLLIAFQAYLLQNNSTSLDQMPSFASWMQAHVELNGMLEDISEGGMLSLRPVHEVEIDSGVFTLTNEVTSVIRSRSGAVLAPLTILKSDHFPGCQKLSLLDRIDGAPNFRQVALSQFGARTGPSVFACAVPTVPAIKLVVSRTGAGPGGARTLLWTSLREEPVVYVNGNPYVLRSVDDPLKNLETTGIARVRVESMEEKLRNDILAEAAALGNRLLLHGESDTGVVIPVWEAVTEADVLTPKQAYAQIQQEGYNVDYLRVPITDEQAPIPEVFDELLSRVMRSSATTDLLFNCQMGRGRTTTGMVITCIVELCGVFASRATGTDTPDEEEVEEMRLLATPDSMENAEKQRLLDGHYRVIQQLVRVLSHGRRSKGIADRAMDACAHVQNLRTAIYEFKARCAVDINSKQRDLLVERATNYLVRYFYLICFANYLLDEAVYNNADCSSAISGARCSFQSWLTERQEIALLVDQAHHDIA
ncbi:hypothetical protein CAOG_06581 [Capsaspora owczarzaki ATCC 30864]|uniref:hypothetical protein n=1 Tax=Capsaspora owczarzaki (strain ATCC 30864) TaxID=595528 RepID=UPI0001FE3817|nr:hypothetical protein CAOG_06581 [Capsaspora owczarzaki ATCC 30864]|eukprot:XP_004345330.1 hypothetical protein CAOG_06581 [Capsaspora owczarzaki ATCC 30864]